MSSRAFPADNLPAGLKNVTEANGGVCDSELANNPDSIRKSLCRSQPDAHSRLAPIALFAYRRVGHLAAALDALVACPEFKDSEVFVFSDGPNASSEEEVASVRRLLRARQTPNMTIVESPTNRGLAASVTSGVSLLCREFGRVVVIEDDLVVAPSALTWFNKALDRYKDEESVWQISAHQFAVPEFSARDEAMFLDLATSWGWAVWNRSWERYDPDAAGWERLKMDRNLRRRFDFDNSYPYSDMLIDQMNGRIDSWAIRWDWAMFRAGGVCLYPPRSLVKNVGFDETATHGRFRLLKRFARRRDLSFVAKTEKCPAFPKETRVVPSDNTAVAQTLRNSGRLTNRLRAAFGGL
jgi:hypothetical protein